MKWLFISLVTVLTLSLLLTSAFGFKCYVCDTSKSPVGCQTNSLNESFLKECEDEHKNVHPIEGFFCRKINQVVEKLMGATDDRIVRQCGWEPTHRDCYGRAGFGSRISVCTCYSEKCNSALNLPINWKLILITIAASVSLRQLL